MQNLYLIFDTWQIKLLVCVCLIKRVQDRRRLHKCKIKRCALVTCPPPAMCGSNLQTSSPLLNCPPLALCGCPNDRTNWGCHYCPRWLCCRCAWSQAQWVHDLIWTYASALWIESRIHKRNCLCQLRKRCYLWDETGFELLSRCDAGWSTGRFATNEGPRVWWSHWCPANYLGLDFWMDAN